MLKIGCHVSAAGGVYNAPKNAADLECETFQIFTRPPMGGKAPELTDENISKFKSEMEKYQLDVFVVHCPYFINFGSDQPRIYNGSISVVGEELKRANLLGARFVMTHLGSAKVLGREKALAQTKKGLIEVLQKYKGTTQFLLEIAAGAGETLGGTFEQLAELMEPLKKFKTFGGICFDTQHAFASGYDMRDNETTAETFKKFDKIIGLKWLKMSHLNDSKPELGSRRDRHEHIGDGQIGVKGFGAILGYLNSSPSFQKRGEGEFCLILETEHDKVKEDIELLKKLRNKNL
jgi:deoxyribonuclease IV